MQSKSIRGLLLAGSLILSVSNVAAESRAEREIIVLCEQLFADYAVYIDQLNADGFANTFVVDGVLARGLERTVGRANLKKYIEDHGDQAHLIMLTSTEIIIQSDTEATGLAYGIILNGDRPVKTGDAPVQMNGITAGTEYRANFQLTDEGWKISRIELEGIFIGPGYVKS